MEIQPLARPSDGRDSKGSDKANGVRQRGDSLRAVIMLTRFENEGSGVRTLSPNSDSRGPTLEGVGADVGDALGNDP